MARRMTGINLDDIMKEVDIEKAKTNKTKKKATENEESENTAQVKQVESNQETNQPSQEDYKETYIKLFGKGFSMEDYEGMYEKFVSLANNYPLKTAFHTEALATYVKYAYRRDVAIAEGDADMAKTWGVLAKDQADKAKINPNQLSVADLSDGMTSFSQLSSMVEKAQDIIPLLPEFKEQPKDRVDYTLWEYVNCVLHLFGKPLIEYKELYKFLDYRYESLKKRYKFIKKEDNGNFYNDDVDSED